MRSSSAKCRVKFEELDGKHFYNIVSCNFMNVAVIDVRTPEEHAKLFINNSYNFPLEKFDDSDSGKNLWDCIHQRKFARAIIIHDNEEAVLKSRIPHVIDDVSGGTAALSYLKGGLASFYKKYPFVCAKPEGGNSWGSFEQIAVSWPSRITRYVYLGDWQSASNETVFDNLGIKHVVNCCKERNAFEDKEGFMYHNVSIVDHPSADISTYFEAVVDFIDQATKQKQKVLVHCHAGVSRSTTVVVAFLMKTKRWPYKKALNYVKQRRYIVDPNFGFVEQLRKFEESLGLSSPAEENKTA